MPHSFKVRQMMVESNDTQLPLYGTLIMDQNGVILFLSKIQCSRGVLDNKKVYLHKDILFLNFV